MHHIELSNTIGISKELAETLINKGIISSYEKGDTFSNQGDQNPYFVIIIHGMLKAVRHTEEGKEIFIGILNSGSSLHETFVFNQEPLGYSSICLTESKILKITNKDAKSLLESSHEFSNFVVRSVVNKARVFGEILTLAHESDTESKVFKALKIIHDFIGIHHFPLSNESIGSMLGVSRNSVSSALKSLHAKNLVTVEYGCVKLHKNDYNRLKK